MLRAWRGEHGNWCPGYHRDAHPASDLTADHVVPLAAGGAPLDIANLAVLCRSCNSTKGASGADRGYPHGGSALVEDRVVLAVTRVTLVTVFCLLLRPLTLKSPARHCGSSPTT